jgi:hypothetical protein
MTQQRLRPAFTAEWPDPHELLVRARELVHSIEGFIHLTPEERRRINTAASLPNDFYSTGAGILDQYEWLAAASDLTGQEVRRTLDETPGYNGLATELELIARGLRGTLAARRASVGRRLLLMYEIARRNNRQGDGPHIKEVEYLERILRERRRGRKGRGEAPSPNANAEDEDVTA